MPSKRMPSHQIEDFFLRMALNYPDCEKSSTTRGPNDWNLDSKELQTAPEMQTPSKKSQSIVFSP
jgi:hypothetical protein